MPLRRSFGVPLSCALLLSAGAGCDYGSSATRPSTGGSPAGAASGGSSGSGGSGGAVASGPGGACKLTSECTEQVCSPSGRCVDCSGDQDCLTGQHCSAERCVANGETGGAGGGGGSGGANACGGAQVLFVIQRSGAMFEQPSAENSYWSMLKVALVGTNGFSGVVAPYWTKLDVGALAFVRLQAGDDVTCPVLSSSAPALGSATPVSNLFESSSTDYQTQADAQTKMDAPVPEAVAAGAALLQGQARHLVLITTGAPDTCTETDGKCSVDPSIKAVQEAQKLGVVAHVVGLGNTDRLNASGDDKGYETYLTQLANAGRGKPVKKSALLDNDCKDSSGTAAYSADANGDARAYRAENSEQLQAALSEILKSICP